MVWENCLYSVNQRFNKTLIGQAGSIGRKARQEVEVEQRDWEYSRKLPLPLLRRPPKRQHVTCPAEKGTEPCANIDKDNGVT